MESSVSQRKIVLFVTTLSAFLIPFMGSSVNVALPSIGTEFNLSAITLSWVATSYLLAAAIFLLPLGKLADSFGRKKIFTAGILLYTLGSILTALSSDTVSLIGFRVIQGFGGSMLFATGMPIVLSRYSPGERGKILGINVSAVYFGLSAGPFIGGILTEFLGWRSIFYFNGLLGLTALWLSWSKLSPDPAPQKQPPFEMAGTIIYSCSFVSLMYGASHLSEPYGIYFLLCGILGLVFFTYLQLRIHSPLVDIRLFKTNKVFIFSNIAALINYSATFAIGFLISLYLQYHKGLSPQYAGYILVTQPIIQALLSPFTGHLSDRIEPRKVASAGMIISMIGLFFFAFLDENTSIVFIILNLIFLGTGFALFSSPNTNAIMGSVDRTLYGIASAMVGTMRLTGQVMSMAIATLVFSYYIGFAKPSPENLPEIMISLRLIFLIFSILSLFGLFASLVRGNVRNGSS